jgi:hypothetical protein
LERLCEIVIRMIRPRPIVSHRLLSSAENKTPRIQDGALG